MSVMRVAILLIICLVVKPVFAEPPRYAAAPHFMLTDQLGQPFEYTGLKGHVWIANFIFTRCQTMCPMLSGRMAKLQTEFSDTNVKLISFSVDPDYDQPHILKAYAAKYGAQQGQWFFLTGEKTQIQKLVTNGFHLGLAEATQEDLDAGAEPVMHSSRFVLVDRQGQVRGYYDSAEPGQLAELIKNARALGAH